MDNFAPAPIAATSAPVARQFAPGVHVIKLLGAIGPDDRISAAAVRRQLDASLGAARHLHVELTTTGGKLDEAFKIHEMLRAQPVPVSVLVSRQCLSAGMVVLMAGELRIAARDTELLIHPTGFAREELPERVTADSLSAHADRLAQCDLRTCQLFADRTGHDLDWFRKEQDTEYLLSDADAISTGLVHEFEGITGPARPAWPAAVRQAMATVGNIYFPSWMCSPNYFAACRVAGSLFGEEIPA